MERSSALSKSTSQNMFVGEAVDSACIRRTYTSRHAPCPCHRANAMVIVPSCLSNHAYAIVPCNCCRAHGCATMPVPMRLCQGHRAWAIVAAPVYPCHHSTKTTCHCLCHRFLFHNQRHPGCQHRFRHLPIDGAALLVQLLPILVAHNG